MEFSKSAVSVFIRAQLSPAMPGAVAPISFLQPPQYGHQTSIGLRFTCQSERNPCRMIRTKEPPNSTTSQHTLIASPPRTTEKKTTYQGTNSLERRWSIPRRPIRPLRKLFTNPRCSSNRRNKVGLGSCGRFPGGLSQKFSASSAPLSQLPSTAEGSEYFSQTVPSPSAAALFGISFICA